MGFDSWVSGPGFLGLWDEPFSPFTVIFVIDGDKASRRLDSCSTCGRLARDRNVGERTL